jgi:hypothetical protein
MNSKVLRRSDWSSSRPTPNDPVQISAQRDIWDRPLVPAVLVAARMATGFIVPIVLSH